MRWTLAFFLLPILACNDSDDGPTDLQEAGLKGPVQKVIEEEYRAIKDEGGLTKDELLSRSIYEYSEQGFVTRSSYEVPAYRYSESYEYDHYGNPLKLVMRSGEDEVLSECVLNLDNKGRIQTEVWKDVSGNQESAYRNTYNSSGQLIETKAYAQADSLRVIRRFSYNQFGKVDTASSYTPRDVLQNYVVKQYENDWLVASTNYMNRGESLEVISRISVKYSNVDEHGNWLLKRRKIENRMNNEVAYRIVGRQLQYFQVN